MPMCGPSCARDADVRGSRRRRLRARSRRFARRPVAGGRGAGLRRDLSRRPPTIGCGSSTKRRCTRRTSTGTRNVIAAARAAGVRRLVHTSTVGALGIAAERYRPRDHPGRPRSDGRAVQAFEVSGRAGGAQSGPRGRPDRNRESRRRRSVRMTTSRRRPAGLSWISSIGGCRPSWKRVSIWPASRTWRAAICSRRERGRVGEKYILGGENLTLEELLRRLARLAGLPAPRFKIPYAVAYGFALGAEAVARTLTHRPPRASLTEVRMARKKMFFDSAKAAAELGYAPGPLDDATRARDRLFPPQRDGAGGRRMSVMALLVSTIALRPYVFVFLAAFLLGSIVNFGWRTTLLFMALTYLVAFACEWSSVHNGFPVRPLSLRRGDARPRNLDRRRAAFRFALLYLSRFRQLRDRASARGAALSRAASICACLIPGRSGARRGYG